MRTVATFKSSSFNTSEVRAFFINPNCFGDDLARWLISRLREAFIATDDEPDQEDFGWYFNFSMQEGEHCCVLGYRPGEAGNKDGEWVVWLERRRGLLGSLVGGRNRGIAQSAIAAIHTALSSGSEIRTLRWHLKHDFDANREDQATKIP